MEFRTSLFVLALLVSPLASCLPLGGIDWKDNCSTLIERAPLSKYFGVLGWDNITSDWYGWERYINCLAYDRDVINTQFFLHTRKTVTDYETISADDPATITASQFDADRKTIFIVHGFLDNGNTEWLTTLAKTLLVVGNYNVIRVGWGGGSLPPYFQATANTRIAGKEIAYLVNYMIANNGVDASKVHIIGHSLGSHVAGYAGSLIPGLGRITGLDPAGPFYYDLPNEVRLDSTDATFVDAIHTDAPLHPAIGWGMLQKSGHIDFYPNGGYHQPGCSEVEMPIWLVTMGMIDAGRDIFACSHLRSIDLFIDAVTSACKYTGYQCTDIDTFEDGNCYTCGDDNSQCAVMGLDAIDYASVGNTEIGVPFYFTTDEASPFCLYHYRVGLNTADPRKAKSTVKGEVMVSLIGDRSIEDIELTDGNDKITHGESYSYLFTSHIDTGKVTSAEITWKDSKDLGGCVVENCYLFVSSLEVTPLEYYPGDELEAYSSTLIDENGDDYVKLDTHGEATLVASS